MLFPSILGTVVLLSQRGGGTLPPLCRSPPLVLPQGGVGDRHLGNPKRAKPPPKGAVQSIPVESGERVQEFKVKWSRTKKFYTQRVKE